MSTYVKEKAFFLLKIPDEPFLHQVPYEKLTPAECPDGLKSTTTHNKHT